MDDDLYLAESDPEPSFLRFTANGKVHVLKDYVDPFGADAVPEWEGSMAQAMLKKQRAYCGATGGNGELHGISAFPDNDLCWRCRTTWPHAPELLFEHPTSYDEEPW